MWRTHRPLPRPRRSTKVLGCTETVAQPSLPYPPAVIPAKAGIQGEGPRLGGSCFTFTTSPFTASYAKVSYTRGFMNIDVIFPNGLTIDDALLLLQPAAVYVLGMALYAIFVFKFYRFIAARDMFALDLSRYQESRFRWMRGFLHVVLYVVKYVVLFPAFAFFWFAVLTLILTFLSKDRMFSEILLIALATVSAIRVAAYYNEDLSRDLAKILPFAVLAIFLIDGSFFQFSESFEVLKEVNNHRESILYYLLFLVAVEFALRPILAIASYLFRKRVPTSKGRPADGSDAAPPSTPTPVATPPPPTPPTPSP